MSGLYSWTAMTTKRRPDDSALDQYVQGLGSCRPLEATEERRLTTKMRRLREELTRLLNELPEPHRCRFLGGIPDGREMPFAQMEGIVSWLTREAEERPDAALVAPARRARAILQVLASARATLITRNLRLTYHLARRIAGGGALLADIIQVGNMGLLEAADRFDPGRGVRFSTYAGTCITGVIIREMPGLTQAVRVPNYQLRLRKQLDQSRRGLAQDLSREPTLAETAARARLTEEKAREVLATKPTIVGLDAPWPGTDTRTLADALAEDAISLQDQTILNNMLEHLQDILASLEPRLRTVLRLRYGLAGERPRTLKEIGESMRLSKERIRQLEEEAMKLVRARMRNLSNRRRPSRATRARTLRPVTMA
jgi:RNA polymerase sigma factor (sigma-70 family)